MWMKKRNWWSPSLRRWMNKMTSTKFRDVELEQEELSTKFDKANQTIKALRFKNNFLVEKTKKLEVELFKVRA